MDDGIASGGMRRPVLTIVDVKKNRKFRYSGPFNDTSVCSWLSQYKSRKLKPYLNSQPRPVNDADPQHPGVVQLTAHTFEELVIHSEKSVLLVIVNDGLPTAILSSASLRRALYCLSDTLPHDELTFATFDTSLNDVPSQYLPTHLPEAFLFAAGNKAEPGHAPVDVAGHLEQGVEQLKLELPTATVLHAVDVEALEALPAVQATNTFCLRIKQCVENNNGWYYVWERCRHIAADDDLQQFVDKRAEARSMATQLARIGHLDDSALSQLEAAEAAVDAWCMRWSRLLAVRKVTSCVVDVVAEELAMGGDVLSARQRRKIDTAMDELSELLACTATEEERQAAARGQGREGRDEEPRGEEPPGEDSEEEEEEDEHGNEQQAEGRSTEGNGGDQQQRPASAQTSISEDGAPSGSHSAINAHTAAASASGVVGAPQVDGGDDDMAEEDKPLPNGIEEAAAAVNMRACLTQARTALM